MTKSKKITRKSAGDKIGRPSEKVNHNDNRYHNCSTAVTKTLQFLEESGIRYEQRPFLGNPNCYILYFRTGQVAIGALTKLDSVFNIYFGDRFSEIIYKLSTFPTILADNLSEIEIIKVFTAILIAYLGLEHCRVDVNQNGLTVNFDCFGGLN